MTLILSWVYNGVMAWVTQTQTLVPFCLAGAVSPVQDQVRKPPGITVALRLGKRHAHRLFWS